MDLKQKIHEKHLEQSVEEVKCTQLIIRHGVVHFKCGDKIRIKDIPVTYSFGSMVSYSIEHKECPINNILNGIKNNSLLHWLNRDYGDHTNLDGVVDIQYGQTIAFEGRLFTIERNKDSERNSDNPLLILC